ncbi:hypothetical protein DFS34DRAFT_467172 [Phlyctochytrium arcticum]|nr:hypothetical protein DFS34DRAFT_467172 [Phlyctochytrium arcticum]
MLRNLPSVRAINRHMQHADSHHNKENSVGGGPRTPGGKPPGGGFKTPARGLGGDKENVYVGLTNGKLAGKTPGLRVPSTALQGKSVNVRETKPPPVIKGGKTPGGPQRPALQEKTVNTPHPVSRPTKVTIKKTPGGVYTTPRRPVGSAGLPRRDLTSTMVVKEIKVNQAETFTPPKSIRSRKSSSGKSSGGSLTRKSVGSTQQQQQQQTVTSISPSLNTTPDPSIEESIEYMPPTAIIEKYVPDPTLTLDHDFLSTMDMIPSSNWFKTDDDDALRARIQSPHDDVTLQLHEGLIEEGAGATRMTRWEGIEWDEPVVFEELSLVDEVEIPFPLVV